MRSFVTCVKFLTLFKIFRVIKQINVVTRVPQERKRLGETQTDWADLLGVTRSAIAMVETNRVGLDTENLMKLWDHGVDALYVLTGRRSEAIGGELINWTLVERIADRFGRWEAEKGIRIPDAKRATVLKLLYLRFSESARTSDTAIDEMLNLAA